MGEELNPGNSVRAISVNRSTVKCVREGTPWSVEIGTRFVQIKGLQIITFNELICASKCLDQGLAYHQHCVFMAAAATTIMV